MNFNYFANSAPDCMISIDKRFVEEQEKANRKSRKDLVRRRQVIIPKGIFKCKVDQTAQARRLMRRQ